MVIVSGKFAREHKLTPLFKIRGFGDAARDPVEFTTAPSDAVPRAMKHAGVAAGDVQYHEINEAFSVVPLVNARYMFALLCCSCVGLYLVITMPSG